mmetsp:Transcript_4438/g.9502  ORF Transcript_4438/g.9502 Transcript_4438/m.9502 type:complete len:105 (+) Transcript_4438:3336-3650(+)
MNPIYSLLFQQLLCYGRGGAIHASSFSTARNAPTPSMTGGGHDIFVTVVLVDVLVDWMFNADKRPTHVVMRGKRTHTAVASKNCGLLRSSSTSPRLVSRRQRMY